ncbi:phosphotransferase family protein [Nocardia jejuensis]|uniref:phosphotransferase family protein n=1 Tax=Nocardia jejuensis TaxID=328049 RepID=UPI0008355381|nr:phosphotransferase family protein [Nocardia jejuensis]
MSSRHYGTDLPGLDLRDLTAWLSGAHPDLIAGELRGRLITGGRSNLTYEITDGSVVFVLRRPPLGHVLRTAHDMAREHRVISALGDTGVPVPDTYLLCVDDEIIGAPFYLMEFVAGAPYRTRDELTALGPDRTRAISTGLIDTLAALHSIDPVSVGLGDFGRPDGFLERQVRRWKQQLDASHSRELPAAAELHRLLAAHRTADSAPRIVHGDYRLDNVLIDARDRVAAVIDWEMATLGDPLTDIGLLVLYQRLGALGIPVATDVVTAPGFLGETAILERYSALTGRDLTQIGFYLALASFKLAVIIEGIHYRYLQGQTVGSGFESVGEVVEPLLSVGIAAVKEIGK